MGASGWIHTTPYVDDPATTLRLLREAVFAVSDFSGLREWGCPVPASLGELFSSPVYREYLGTCGTHSILDVDTFSDDERDPDDWHGDLGVLRQWPDEKVAEVFGTDEPTRADLDAVGVDALYDADDDLIRWSGRCIVLYPDGEPDELFVWGLSGD